MLYTLGSAIFLAAGILFHPRFTADPVWYLTAVSAFVAGSLMFTAAGALGVWAVMRRSSADSGAWGTAILSLVGALLLLAGSLAFWPGLEDGADIGAHTFSVGSVAYILSSGWSLRAMWLASPPPRRFGTAARWQLVTLAAYTAGAVGFIGGELCFVEEEPVHVSMQWAVGSLMFLVGSAVPLARWRVQKDPPPTPQTLALG